MSFLSSLPVKRPKSFCSQKGTPRPTMGWVWGLSFGFELKWLIRVVIRVKDVWVRAISSVMQVRSKSNNKDGCHSRITGRRQAKWGPLFSLFRLLVQMSSLEVATASPTTGISRRRACPPTCASGSPLFSPEAFCSGPISNLQELLFTAWHAPSIALAFGKREKFWEWFQPSSCLESLGVGSI